jgi:effector-binding domain-containing protein
MQIELNRSIKFENVISFRKKMKHTSVNTEVAKFIHFLKESDARKNGPMMSANFGIETLNGEQILDMEFLVPVDKKIDLPKEYKFKSLFHIVNAVYTRHIGNPLALENVYTELSNFLKQNEIHQITVAYNVNVNDEMVSEEVEPIIDIYIGANPSIL